MFDRRRLLVGNKKPKAKEEPKKQSVWINFSVLFWLILAAFLKHLS